MGKRNDTGMTLVELLIAMAVGLLMMGFIAQILISSNRSYEVQDALAGVQENGRFATQFLARNLRGAGGWGCISKDEVLNHLDGADDGSYNPDSDFRRGIEGEDGVGFDATTSGGIDPADTVTISRADTNSNCELEGDMLKGGKQDPSVNLDVNNSCSVVSGDKVFITDCSAGDIFQATPNTSAGKIGHNTGSGLKPGNRKIPNASPNCPGNVPNCLSKAYDSSAMIGFPGHFTFFVEDRNKDDPDPDAEVVPVLYRDDGTGDPPEELVAGVENLQILYGKDTDDDGSVNAYLSAGDIGGTTEDWNKVISVRIAVVVRTRDDEALEEPADYTVFGTTYTPTDRRARRVFTTTVFLRNQV